MTEYICKCGKEIRKSTTAAVTGNRMDGYAPGHECFGCPYVVEQTKYTKYPDQEIFYECKMTKSVMNITQTDGFIASGCVGYIHSLDFDFLTKVADACRADEHLTINQTKDKRIFDYAAFYDANGLYRFSIYPTANKAGIAAKMAIFNQFFNEDGTRKDTGGADETEIVQAQIARGKELAQLEQGEDAHDINVASMAEHTEKRTETHACDLEAEKTHDVAILEAEPTEETDVTDTNVADKLEQPEPDDRSTLVASPLDTVSAALAPAFDYSDLDQNTINTLHAAENLIMDARRYYITECANAVGIVHDALCGGASPTVKRAQNNQHSDDTFIAWCESVGLKKTTAYRFLQVNALMKGATDEEQAILEAAPATLLYAAAKPSAPTELVEAVKQGDITSNAEYQKLLKEKQAAEARADEEREKYAKEFVKVQTYFGEKLRAEQTLKSATAQLEHAEKRAEEAEEKAKRARVSANEANDLAHKKIVELNQFKREVESRPVEVAVQQPSAVDIERYRKEGAAAANAEWREKYEDIEAQNQCLNDMLKERAAEALELPNVVYDVQEDTAAIIYEMGKRTAETVESALQMFFETAALQPDVVYRPALQFLLVTYDKFSAAIQDGEWQDLLGEVWHE